MSVELLIREARLAAGLSQGELAERANTSQPAISAYENGLQPPNSETLLRLIDACGGRLVVASESPTAQTTLAGMVAALVDAGEFDDEHFVLRWSLNQFARNDWDELSLEAKAEALRDAPPPSGSRRWDAFFAALAEYLAETAQLPIPRWVDDPKRILADGPMWYPGRSGDAEISARRVNRDPAPWFTRRGIGLEMKALPSGKGKDVVAAV